MIIPANPGFSVIVGFHDDDPGEQPHLLESYPVIAWEIGDCAPRPITAVGDPFSEHSPLAVSCPDGRVWGHECFHENVEAWVRFVKRSVRMKKLQVL